MQSAAAERGNHPASGEDASVKYSLSALDESDHGRELADLNPADFPDFPEDLPAADEPGLAFASLAVRAGQSRTGEGEG